MFKALILSSSLVVLWAILQLLLLQSRGPRDALSMMVKSFLPVVPAFFLAYALTPPTLGFLPAGLSKTPALFGMLDGFLVLVLLFVTCVQFYYHFHNSITLRLLTAFEGSPTKSMTQSQIEVVCGLGALLSERLEALQRSRLVYERGDRYYPTAAGILAAGVGRLARAVMPLRP